MWFWVLLWAAPVWGQDWGSLHIFNGDVAVGKHGALQLHTRVRTYERFREYFQLRGGPVYYHQTRPWFQAIGGYYYADEDTQDGSLNRFHRIFGGGQFASPTGRAVRLEARTLVERFENTRAGDFWRARERLWLTHGTGKWRPYTQGELLRQEGKWILRAGAGMGWRGERRDVLFGYEFRQLPSGLHLHIVTSNLTMRLRQRRN
jgi:hypothetical protein